jgi:hypothetical protein
LTRFIATLDLGERRPNVTLADGDARVLIDQELARQKTDLLVLGPCTGSNGTARGRATVAPGAGSCDVLFLSPDGRADR